MFRYSFTILFFAVSAFGSSVWSDKTQPLPQEEVQSILEDAKKKEFFNVDFANDTHEDRFSVRSNIFVLTLSAGMTSVEEKLSNQKGEKSASFGSKEIKFVIGKDFTLWHDEFYQYSRLFAGYTYSQTDDGVKYSTFSFGLQERMRYWTFYSYDNWDFYPRVSLEFGKSMIERESYTIDGFTSEYGVGIVAQYKYKYEVSLDTAYKTTRWKYPIDGIDDRFNGMYFGLSVSYRMMYGDF